MFRKRKIYSCNVPTEYGSVALVILDASASCAFQKGAKKITCI